MTRRHLVEGVLLGALGIALGLLPSALWRAQAQGVTLVTAAEQTGTVYDGGMPLLPKFAVVDAATSGNNTLVAAVTGKKIRVLAGSLTMTGTAVTLRFESAADGTALTGQFTPLQGSTVTLPFSPIGHFQTVAGELLNLELGGAQSVDGWLVYVEVS